MPALRASFARLFLPFTLFLWMSCWIVAVLAGPFGTYEALNLGWRIFYWGGIVTGAIVVGFTVRSLVLTLLGSENTYSFALVAAGIMTLVFAPLVIGLRSFVAMYSDGLGVEPVSIILNTFVIAAAIFILRRFLLPEVAHSEEPAHRGNGVADGPANLHAVPQARLMRRLPDDVRGEILCLSANNHHVFVTTSMGGACLRLRLSDAIDEMDPIEGFCVHRSHWVAMDAIDHVQRINAQKAVVYLNNGDEIPVSRKYRINLEQAGFLQDSEVA